MAPAFLVRTTRIGAKKHAAGLQRRVQLLQHACQIPTRDMKQGGVGENAVKACERQIEAQKILLQHLAAGLVARHRDEAFGTIETNRVMTQRGEGLKISPRPAAKIEDRKRRLDDDMTQ